MSRRTHNFLLITILHSAQRVDKASIRPRLYLQILRKYVDIFFNVAKIFNVTVPLEIMADEHTELEIGYL